MILGTKARYAVMAMVDLAMRDAARPVTLAQLAEAQAIPLPYLEQIFAMLRKAGLVASVRGPGGGYQLAQAAGDITVASIIVAVEESLKMTRCAGDVQAGCMGGKAQCATHDLWEGLGQQIHRYLSGITLEDVRAGKFKVPENEARAADCFHTAP